jgi:hypothetical protein
MEPEADRVTLIRRAYFDLTGLPPAPADVKTFVEDKSPNAWEKVIDHLLASRHYGEQWGRHWLDVAGYSDSRGDAGDSDREVAWKYRDYVIHALNENKPINRFLVEQMAGGQLVNYKPGTQPTAGQVEPLIATGFLRTTADITDNQTIYEVDKYFDAQKKAMETSLSAVMGLTIQCARCHDHKFDPILQRDYYKMMAVYQAAWDVSKTPSATYVLARGNYLSPGAEVQPGIPVVLDNPQHPFQFPDPAKHPEWNGTNGRLILAKWMVSPENPLVSRVFVNRVWQ